MSKKIERIVKDAEYEVVNEEPKAEEQSNDNMFALDTVAEMVMVGRLKDGTEFVQVVNFDDALKAKGYLDYASRHFDMLIDRALFLRLKEKENGNG